MPDTSRSLPHASEPQAQEEARYLWEGRYGAMLIEVHEGVVYVNGSPVEPSPEAEPRPNGGRT